MSKETDQLLELVVKAAQTPNTNGNILGSSKENLVTLLDLIIQEAIPVKTFEVTFTPAQMKTIGFGQTILPPSPEGYDYVILSAEAFLDWPVSFGQAYDLGGMNIKTNNTVGNWFEFTSFLDRTEPTFHTGTPVVGSKTLFNSLNGDVILTGVNSTNGNSPVTVTGTYKLIPAVVAQV